MKKFKLTSLLLIPLLVACGVSTFQDFSTSSPISNAPIKRKLNEEQDYDFSGETEVDSSELNVVISSATTTETSYSFTVGLTSKKVTTLYSVRYRNYYIAIDDPNFSGNYQDPLEGGTTEDGSLPQYNGYVYRIYNDTATSSLRDVHIPSTITKASKMIINVTAIGANAVSSWENIDNIYIPSTITTIGSGAFLDNPAETNIIFEADEANAPFCEEDWITDTSKIQYGVSDPTTKARDVNSGGELDFGNAKNFIIGFYGTGKYAGPEYQLPFVASYNIENTDGSVNTGYYTFSKVSKQNDYDGVGALASQDVTRSMDIHIEKGQKIDINSIRLHNIFPAIRTQVGEPYTPDLSIPLCATPKVRAKHIYDISDFLNITYDGCSSFCGHSTFVLNIDKNITDELPRGIYPEAMPASYEQNKNSIDNGSVSIRYTFQTLYNCYYHVKYMFNGELKDVNVKVSTPVSYQIISKDKGDKLSFMFPDTMIGEGFSIDNLVFFEIVGLTVQIDLFKNTGVILAKSQLTSHFGRITVVDTNESAVGHFNVNLFLILFCLIYIVGFVGVSIALYFYLKNKYKNDEFRRMNTKNFIKSDILYLVGSLIFVLAIVFIILRCTKFISTVVVFNPIDIFVIFFSLVGLIIFGYFVKIMVTTIKTEKERRKTIKLKLNEDTADDGTN